MRPGDQTLIGVQGLRGSACDAAATMLLAVRIGEFRQIYFVDADAVLGALNAGEVDAAVIVSESPLGRPVEETARALLKAPADTLEELCTEVRHCVVGLPGQPVEDLCWIASHPIPLEKHRPYLRQLIPGYQEIVVADTGLAAQQLAAGELPANAAVIALPAAADAFGLTVLIRQLPANDDYLSLFLLVKSSARVAGKGSSETL